MKIIILSVLSLLTWVCSVGAQNYAINWSKIAGGGGMSTNAQYALSGTIGQPDASAALTNSQYTVTGGFWSLFALQSPGAPLLSIQLTATNTAVVSWPSSSTGFRLQQADDLFIGNWSDIPDPVNDDGLHKFVVVALTPANRFYRLKLP